ncbi:hypothetical protein STRIP9103_01526, partial [Streptomyces ipomoeae 91-03]
MLDTGLTSLGGRRFLRIPRKREG